MAYSHCGRNRTLAVDLACSGPLAGLKRSLGGRKCCDAGLRPLWAGSPGMQRYNGVEGRRSSCAVGLGLQRADLPCCDEGLRPLRAGSPDMQHFNAAYCQQRARIDNGGRGVPPGGADCHRGGRFATGGPKQLADHEVHSAEPGPSGGLESKPPGTQVPPGASLVPGRLWALSRPVGLKNIIAICRRALAGNKRACVAVAFFYITTFTKKLQPNQF